MPSSSHCLEVSPIASKEDSTQREQIGLIGCGLMGGAMAERFQACGFAVVGIDIDGARQQALVSRGGRAGASLLELAGSCRRIILSLPNSDVVQMVLDQMKPHLRSGQVIIDTTTGRPEAAVQAARSLAEHEVNYVEATISGNSNQVRKGEVLVMTSGSADAATECEDLLACFASKILHVGVTSSATKMKLVSNLVLGLNRAVLAEGLAFARKVGLDPEKTLAVLREGMGYSQVMDTKGGKMIAGDFEPQARLSQHLKDVRLILITAAESGAHVPLSEIHEQLLKLAESSGWGALDNSAIIRVFEQKP